MHGRPTLLLAAACLTTGGPVGARRAAPDDWDTVARREHDRGERALIRDEVRGWTWAAVPPLEYAEGTPGRRALRLTALAAGTSGDAVVAGTVQGPLRLGETVVGAADEPQGFIARVDSAGVFRLVRPTGRVTRAWPSALAIDRAGRILVSYEDAKLEMLSPRGRALWSRDLPSARALAVAANGDILAAGCRLDEGVGNARGGRAIGPPQIADAYVARISPQGEVRWTYALARSHKELLHSPLDRVVEDCATGIAVASEDELYVAGHYSRPARTGRSDEPGLPRTGSFLARFTADGRLRWLRPVAPGWGRVALAASADGALAVVAGQVIDRDGDRPSDGLAAFHGDGKPAWSVPARRVPPGGGFGWIDDLQVVAHRDAKRGFVCVGSTRDPLEFGGATLRGPGVFLAEVDVGGKLVGLHDVPKRKRPDTGSDLTTVGVGSAAARLWIGGIVRANTTGTWVHAVPW